MKRRSELGFDTALTLSWVDHEFGPSFHHSYDRLIILQAIYNSAILQFMLG